MNSVCPFCKGKIEDSTTTFTVDLGFGIVVVRTVPAQICSLCGADWITDSIAEQLEKVVESARKNCLMIEVSDWQYKAESLVPVCQPAKENSHAMVGNA